MKNVSVLITFNHLFSVVKLERGQRTGKEIHFTAKKKFDTANITSSALEDIANKEKLRETAFFFNINDISNCFVCALGSNSLVSTSKQQSNTCEEQKH